jgi:Multiple myeloma tumor-associated
MDLLATVKKQGSRGGTGDFKWSDVQGSSRREHYLGHSLMAPVGRWQKGRNLNWYAKGDAPDAGEHETSEEKAARQRAEEIKMVKEAEQDALARALGLPVPDRSNPNTQALGARKDMDKIAKDASTEEDAGAEGIGYRATIGGRREIMSENVERIEGNAEQEDRELQYALKEYQRRHGDKASQRRSRSRSRDRDRTHRKRSRDRERERHHHHRRKRSRSLSQDRDRYRRRSYNPEHSHRPRHDRSRSPKRRPDDRRDPRRY